MRKNKPENSAEKTHWNVDNSDCVCKTPCVLSANEQITE